MSVGAKNKSKDPMEFCQLGHEDRKELENLLGVPRIVQPLKDDDKMMKILLGPGNVKKTSVRGLAEEFKASWSGQLLLKGGSLTVPVVDFVKKKFKLKSVETLERLEKELMHFFDKLVKESLSPAEFTSW